MRIVDAYLLDLHKLAFVTLGLSEARQERGKIFVKNLDQVSEWHFMTFQLLATR